MRAIPPSEEERFHHKRCGGTEKISKDEFYSPHYGQSTRMSKNDYLNVTPLGKMNSIFIRFNPHNCLIVK